MMQSEIKKEMAIILPDEGTFLANIIDSILHCRDSAVVDLWGREGEDHIVSIRYGVGDWTPTFPAVKAQLQRVVPNVALN
nr:hypothetical protein Iba_chr04aCG0440 [Ipomoea batatas]GMC81136.1 hypothetical protein Iba_chr04bCG1160 [Ipomoea batatas]